MRYCSYDLLDYILHQTEPNKLLDDFRFSSRTHKTRENIDYNRDFSSIKPKHKRNNNPLKYIGKMNKSTDNCNQSTIKRITDEELYEYYEEQLNSLKLEKKERLKNSIEFLSSYRRNFHMSHDFDNKISEKGNDSLVGYQSKSNLNSKIVNNDQGKPLVQWNEIFNTVIDQDIKIPHLDSFCHSKIALNLYLTNPFDINYQFYHHPQLKVMMDIMYNVTRKPVIINNMFEDIIHRKKAHKALSGKKGTIYMVENLTNNPIYILNVGMSAQIDTYNGEQNENYGFIRNMKKFQHHNHSPFCATIKNSDSITVFRCSLYKAPIYQHKCQHTDFLMIKSRSKNGFIIRRIDRAFCYGLSEPSKPVYKPHSRETKDIEYSLIKAWIFNIFRGTHQYKGRKYIEQKSLIKEYFPSFAAYQITNILSQFAEIELIKGKQYWFLKQGFDINFEFKALSIDPDDICRYQSMKYGYHNLRNHGVNFFSSLKDIPKNIGKLSGEHTICIANKIVEELRDTPWEKSKRFIEISRGNLKAYIQNNDKKIECSNNSSSKQDFRQVKNDELIKELVNNGVPFSKIKNHNRWKLIQLLKTLANTNKENGKKNDITDKFSRNPRSLADSMKKDFMKQYQSEFDTNLVMISKDETESCFEIDNEFFIDTSSDINDFISEERVEHRYFDDNPNIDMSSMCFKKFNVDWDSLGFRNCKKRPVMKIIKLFINDNGHPEFLIEWKRTNLKKFTKLKPINYANMKLPQKETQLSDD